MRSFTKTAAVALLAGAALSVAACHKSDNTADNGTTTEMNSTDTTMDTGSNDMMTTESNMAGGDNSMMMNSADNSSGAMGGSTNNAM